MKRFITYYILCLFLFLGNGHALALQYQTVFLKKAAQKMALDSLLETKAGKNVAKYFDFKGTKWLLTMTAMPWWIIWVSFSSQKR